MSDSRFRLEWNRPFMEGAATHVSLFDGGTGPLYIVASGHGSDDIRDMRKRDKKIRGIVQKVLGRFPPKD